MGGSRRATATSGWEGSRGCNGVLAVPVRCDWRMGDGQLNFRLLPAVTGLLLTRHTCANGWTPLHTAPHWRTGAGAALATGITLVDDPRVCPAKGPTSGLNVLIQLNAPRVS